MLLARVITDIAHVSMLVVRVITDIAHSNMLVVQVRFLLFCYYFIIV